MRLSYLGSLCMEGIKSWGIRTLVQNSGNNQSELLKSLRLKLHGVASQSLIPTAND